MPGDARGGAQPDYFSRGSVGSPRGFPRCGALAAAAAPSVQGQWWPRMVLLQPGSANPRGFREPEAGVRGPPVFSCAGGCFCARGHLEWATPLATSGASLHSSGRTRCPGWMLWAAKSQGRVCASRASCGRDFTRDRILATDCLKQTSLISTPQ